jgi:diguanylate cyclase (GGDEF)-like protein
VEERDLTEIEDRVEQYPPQARHDILRLTLALRRLTSATRPAATLKSTSPLYDELTGLLNGGAYGVRFAMARARATRFRKIFAVMSVDVALDTSGSDASGIAEEERDLMIRHVAGRLEASVRATDTLARIGGENFAVILEDLTHSGHAERVKQIVVDALAEPLVIEGRKVAPDISVGIEFYPSPHQGSEGKPVYN